MTRQTRQKPRQVISTVQELQKIERPEEGRVKVKDSEVNGLYYYVPNKTRPIAAYLWHRGKEFKVGEFERYDTLTEAENRVNDTMLIYL